jgi:ribosomal protein S18 acetylase RimI-like enzyme
MKAQLRTPVAFVSYFMMMFGTIMATRSTNPMTTLGFFIIAFTGCILFLLYRRYLKATFIGFLKQSFEGDLADIPKHYKLAGSNDPNEEKQGLWPITKSGFWVAELDEGGLEPTIVGCLGLGTFSARLTSYALFNSATIQTDAYTNPDETSAELRRVVVSPTHRRQGIANQLMSAAITHGKSNGIRSLFLTTSSHQPAAINMYRKFGWEMEEAVVEMSILFEKVRVHKFHLDL